MFRDTTSPIIWISLPCRGTQTLVIYFFPSYRAEPSADREARNSAFYLDSTFLTYSLYLPAYFLKLIYIFVPWTTPGTPVGQDFVRRTHDYKRMDLNEFCQKFTKMPLRQGGLKFCFTPLLICRGCPRGRGFGQVVPNVVLVRGVLLSSPGGLCLRLGRPLLVPVQAGLWS